MTDKDAIALVRGVYAWILELFPEGEQTYELIFTPRFTGLILDYVGIPADERRGVVIPFPSTRH